jgi:hypothetical protein
MKKPELLPVDKKMLTYMLDTTSVPDISGFDRGCRIEQMDAPAGIGDDLYIVKLGGTNIDVMVTVTPGTNKVIAYLNGGLRRGRLKAGINLKRSTSPRSGPGLPSAR